MSSVATSTAVELPRRGVPNDVPESTAVDIAEASRLADAQVPDGGLESWKVVFGCAVLSWWCVGTSYCWGIIQAALVEDGLSSPSTLAFIGSLTAACIAIFAITNARVLRWLGARTSGMIGLALFALGEVLSGFATKSVPALFITAGGVAGMGLSVCFIVISATPAQYFNKKRGLANGIVFAGGGLGGAANSFVIEKLIQQFGPAWTFRIVGLAMLATGLPAAWLVKERAPIRRPVLIDWQLFRDARFIFIFCAGAVATFPLFVPPFFLPLYARSLSLSPSTGAGLVAGFSFASGVGRILCGLSSDRVGPLNTLFASLVLSGLSMLVLWPISNSIALLVVFVILAGIANGGFFSTMPTVVGNVFGSARVSVAMGMAVTGWAGGYLMGAPIAGYLLQAHGGTKGGLSAYRPAMFYAGSMAMASAGLIAVVKLRIDKNFFKRL